MSLGSRIMNGGIRALFAPINTERSLITGGLSQGRTIFQALGQLLQGQLLQAIGTLLTGTIANAIGTGTNLALGGNPLTAFMQGAITDRNGFEF